MKKSLALILALMMCIGLLAGCSKDEPAKDGATPDGGDAQPAEKVLKLLRKGEDTTLNPHDSNQANNYELVNYMSATLYLPTPSEDGTKAVMTPVYAESEPTVGEDGLTWTIQLRRDAKWPDGKAITADEWLYSWKMAMDPKLMYKTGSGAASGTSLEIENALAYYKSEAENNGMTWEQVGLKKVDDYTVTVTTARRYTAMDVMRHFAGRAMGLVRQEIYETCISADGSTCDYGSAPEKVMFAGTFRLGEWLKGTECTMVKNPNYPLADHIHLDAIYSRVVADESTRLEMFEKGDCDYIVLGTNGMAKYGEDPRVRTYTAKTIHTLEFNHNHPGKPYLADPVFRKAFFYGIDRSAIAKLSDMLPAPYFISTEGQLLDDGTLYRDYGPAKEIVPANGGYDPELARKYLDETLAKYGLDKIELSITYNEDVDARRAASEYIQSSFHKLFEGKLEIELQAMNKSVMLKTMRTSNQNPVSSWDVSWSGWALSAESYMPWRKVNCYTSDYGSRYTPYKNDQLDELCALALTDEYRLDNRKLADLTVEMEKAMYEDMTCVPVVQGLSYSMFSERVELPMKVYVSAIGWGEDWADIK